jgi:hypothetical protein
MNGRWRLRPCDLQKLLNSLKLKKACGIDGIPNECLRHLPRRPLVHLTHLFNHCIRLSHLPTSWKESKVVALPKPGKDPKFPQNLRPLRAKFLKKLFQKLYEGISEKETCLTQVSLASVQFTARHCNVYAVYHSNHPNGTARGGSAIIIKRSIKHHPLPSHNQDFLQATCLSVEDYRPLYGISCLPITQTHS